MSIAENPLVGAMRKSMGNFTTYTLNGMNIVRSKPFRVNDAKSKAQLNMRARMKPISEMYQEFHSIIALGFPERDVRRSPQNMFVSVNFNTAFVMEDEVPVISYPLMLLAKGSLPCVTVTEVTTDARGITISYDADALDPVVTETDEIIACAMLKTGELLMARQFVGFDAIGTLELKYPSLQAEDVACCYVFVRSNDGMKASDSVYVEVNGSLLSNSGGVKPTTGGVKSGSTLQTGGVNSLEQQIMDTVLRLPGLNAQSLAHTLDKSLRTTQRYLKKLSNDRKIEFRGAAKNGGYFPVGNNN